MIELASVSQPNESLPAISPDQPPPRGLNVIFERKWHPSPTYLSTVVVYASFAIVFLVVSIVLFQANGSITELKL